MEQVKLNERIRNLNFTRLKEQLYILFATKFVERFKVVGVRKTELVASFTASVELIAEQYGEKALPNSVILLFNDLYTEYESPLDFEPKTPEFKFRKEHRCPYNLNHYGVRPGYLNDKFIQAVKKDPMTMTEVQNQPWNPKRYKFYKLLAKLRKRGLATIDPKTHKIYIE